MGYILVSKEDEAFGAAVRALDRTVEWKRFAVAGRVVATLARDFGSDGRGVPREPPMVWPAEDKRAWRWGYEWKEGAAPPEERPEGACPECWRLGEACEAHYRAGEE